MENRLWPACEILGDLLPTMHQPEQALKEYELSLQVAAIAFVDFTRNDL